MAVHLRPLAFLLIAGFGCDAQDQHFTGLEDLDVAQLLSLVGEAERRPRFLQPVESKSWQALVEIGNRVEDGDDLTDEQWREALLASGAVGFRERWVASEPFAIWMNAPTWLGNAEVRLTPRDPRLARASGGVLAPDWCGTCELPKLVGQSHQVLGSLARGRQRLEFDVEIERGAPRDFDSLEDTYRPPLLSHDYIWKGELVLEVDVRESLDEVIPAVSGPEVDRALRKALRIVGVVLGGKSGAEGRPAALLVLPNSFEEESPLEDVDVVVDVALEDVGRVWPRGRLHRGGRLNLECSITDLESELASLTITATGASDELLSLWHVERRYSGKVAVTPRELIERGRALGEE